MALFGVVVQKLIDEFLCLFVVHELREFQLVLHDLFIDFIGTFGRIPKRQDST